jgi:FecR protein
MNPRHHQFLNTALWAQLLASLLLIVTAFGASAADDDPPDRVARLSFIQGEVSTLPGEEKTWTEATLNRPLTSGDTLWVKDDSRAELQMGSATLRLDQNTDLAITDLRDNTLALRLSNGALNLFVDRMRDEEAIRIDTPEGVVNITRPGEYHVAVFERGTRTQVKVFSGEAKVDNSRGSTPLHARQSAELVAAGHGLTTQDDIDSRDALDEWSAERNRREQQSASSHYVDDDVIGYHDLDQHGHWVSEPSYGDVWYPTVAVGWAPYRYGRWVSIAPWGWTWIDDAPWGFAPFHYGRWAFVHDHWGWVPGPRHVHAVYAPALVAWMGGPNVSVSVTLGAGVGWFPLAPHEVFIPGYHCSPQHLHSVNISNTYIANTTIVDRAYERRAIHVDYANRNIRNAVTVVNRDNFMRAQPTRDHLMHVDSRELRQWQPHVNGPNVGRGESIHDRWSRTETHVDAQRPNERPNEGSRGSHSQPNHDSMAESHWNNNSHASHSSNNALQEGRSTQHDQQDRDQQDKAWWDSRRDTGHASQPLTHDRNVAETPVPQRPETPMHDFPMRSTPMHNTESHDHQFGSQPFETRAMEAHNMDNRNTESRRFDDRTPQNHHSEQYNNRGQVFGSPQPVRSQPTPNQPTPQPNSANSDGRQHQGRTENRSEDRAQDHRGRNERM